MTLSLIGRPVGEHGSSATDTDRPVSTCPDFRVNVYQMGELARLSFVAGADCLCGTCRDGERPPSWPACGGARERTGVNELFAP
jgi:hypothetical protein